ncbi:MAG TPA: hypothetical protein P5543_01585 [Planctomycetota bacterium]|nr:hypothetical protein [Planctomycetota bacterium]HQA99964.1 hypothetical protein [Planctomycetota bacterium]HRU50867.1 hypothetical protein [Planctomycetota bacterium]
MSFKVILNSIINNEDIQEGIAFLLSSMFQIALKDVKQVLNSLPVVILDNVEPANLACIQDTFIFLSKMGLEFSILSKPVSFPSVSWKLPKENHIISCPNCGGKFYLVSASQYIAHQNQTTESTPGSAFDQDKVDIPHHEVKMPTAMVDLMEIMQTKTDLEKGATTSPSSHTAPTPSPRPAPARSVRPAPARSVRPAPAQPMQTTPAQPVQTAPAQPVQTAPAQPVRPTLTRSARPALAKSPTASAKPPITSAKPPIASAKPPIASAKPPITSAKLPIKQSWEHFETISSAFDNMNMDLENKLGSMENKLGDMEEIEEVGSISEEIVGIQDVVEELQELEKFVAFEKHKTQEIQKEFHQDDSFDIVGIGGISAEFEEIEGVSAEFEKICLEGMDNDIGSLSAELEEIEGYSSEFDSIDIEEGIEKIREISDDFHQRKKNLSEDFDEIEEISEDFEDFEEKKLVPMTWAKGQWKLIIDFAGRGNIRSATQFLAQIQGITLEEATVLARDSAAITVVNGVSRDVADRLLIEFQKLGMQGKIISI